ncbi:MAG: SDR family NAD(P)-dependent oxidoreductase, partial [Verrucomicrobiota bacterium]
MELAGKKVLVTGASSGLGKAFAASLVEKGAHVWGTSRSPGAHDWEEGVTPVSLDLSYVEEIDSQWDSAGLDAIGFDVLVNNAGAGVFGEFEEVGFADWERQVELMLLSPMKLAHLALSQLRASGEGVLANVSSLAVEYPIPFMAGYNAAKGGLTAFSESLALELDPPPPAMKHSLKPPLPRPSIETKP